MSTPRGSPLLAQLRTALVALVLLLGHLSRAAAAGDWALPANGPGSAPTKTTALAGGDVQWRQASAIAGGIALVMLLDAPLREVYRDSRDGTTDALARAARPFGGPWTYVSVGTGLLAVGLVGQDERVLHAGARVGTALVMTGVLTRAGKYAAGRERPAGGRGNHFFEPLSDKTSLPSGHSAMAFALAASLSREIDRGWATIALYTAATATAWSRLNDDIHWTSDVFAGAVLGRECARFVDDRLHFDGEQPPLLLPFEDGVAISWTVGL